MWAQFSRRKMARVGTLGRNVSTMHYSILQLEGEGEKISRRRPHPQKSSTQQRGRDPSWEGPYKIARVLTPGAYQLAHFIGDQIPKSWNIHYLRMYYQ